MTRPAPSSQRQRLLDAAGEIFAEGGFHQATVRKICRRAGANVGAISYHFGDKARLYQAALAQAQGGPDDPTSLREAAAPPQRRLRELVVTRLLRVFDDDRPAWHGKLLSREMVDPTPALDALVDERIRPRCELLQAIVRELLGPRATEEQVRLSALSIIGQCLFYYHARAVLERLFSEQRYGTRQIDRLADHITQFSLRALASARAALESRTRRTTRVSARGRVSVARHRSTVKGSAG